jgi:protein-disulfide isomerase
MNWTRAALLVASLPLVTSGCAGKADATAGSAPAAGQGQADSVVATIEGGPITWDEMEKKAADQLIPLRQEEYQARRAAIEEIAYERLLAREAQHRGLTNEALLKDEVDRKLKAVSTLDVGQAYEQNKARFAGRPKEDVLRDIEKAIGDQRRRNREAEFRHELFDRAKISVKLEAPRVPVEFPASAPTVGPQAAVITLVEFSDYQCPYCHRAQEAVDQILKQYDGKVRFVHREYPIPGHPRAFAAAVAARCASDQGRFWDFHRNLLTVPGDLSDDDFKQRAAGLGLDGAKLGECVGSGRFDKDVNEAREAGSRIGVTGTPTFFINGRMLSGALPVEEFRQIVDEELAKSGG